jgi:hypothetical protein
MNIGFDLDDMNVTVFVQCDGKWVDDQPPSEWNHVFASIQSLAANGLDNLVIRRV